MIAADLALEFSDEQATRCFGDAFARALRPPCVVWLTGELGTGKSTFARAVVHHFDAGMRVRSPTYSLLESYRLPPFALHHLDLYRVQHAAELEMLGLREIERDVLMIEWPGKGGSETPTSDLALQFSHLDEQARGMALTVHTTAGREILARLQRFIETKGDE